MPVKVTIDMDCSAGEEGRSGNVPVDKRSAGIHMRASYVDCTVCLVEGLWYALH